MSAWLADFKQNFSDYLKANPTAFADCKIMCGGQTFDAQRLLLSSRSVVFAAMFGNESTKEAQTKVVEIEDMSPETVSIFLEFIRYDALPDAKIKGQEIPLMDAAEKYQMPGLKREIEFFLISEMTDHNYDIVATAAYLSSVYGLNSAKIKVHHALVCYKNEIVATSSWVALRKSHPKLSVEIEDLADKIIKLCVVPKGVRRDCGLPVHSTFHEMFNFVEASITKGVDGDVGPN